MIKKFISMSTAVLLMASGISFISTNTASAAGTVNESTINFLFNFDLNLMSVPTAPTANNQPGMSAGGNGNQWTQATLITWSPALTNGRFQPGTVYSAQVGISAAAGWNFDGLSSTFFTNSSATSVTATYSGSPRNAATVTAVFPATAGTAPSGSSAGLTPLFSSGSSLDGRYTVQVSNYDSAYTYAVTSTAGQASISSSGLVTVTGLSKDQAVSVTVTTTRTGYDSASASSTGRSQVAPMTPSDKPTVTLSDTLITCTIGSYSAAPTSAAFSLFVDGKHVSTIFSALGEYLPDWIIPWATSSTITRTASLTSATWSMSDAYKDKAITCATLAYSKNAIGFTASQMMVAR
jgi:hypothetical protein